MERTRTATIRRVAALLFAALLAFSLLFGGLAGCKKASPTDEPADQPAAVSTDTGQGGSQEGGDAGSDKPSAPEAPDSTGPTSAQQPDPSPAIDEDGTYTSKDDVALYLHTYGHLPGNYITKSEARQQGWKSQGTLDRVCPGMSIGGDRFSNRERTLPNAPGRTWFECDIDYVRGNRNGKRLVYSNDGLIFYTDDHYNTFEQLY